jgi:hypothetical protein
MGFNFPTSDVLPAVQIVNGHACAAGFDPRMAK